MKRMLLRTFRFIVAVGYLAVIAVMSHSVYSVWRKQDIVVDRESVLAQLEEENRRLKEKLVVAHSPSFVERQAREKLGFVREGETVVIIGRTPNPEHNDEMRLQENAVPNWKKWWGLFF